MERGVVRCGVCQLPTRWCVCAGFRAVKSPLRVDVLMHRREFLRPTSTGRLIERVMTGSRIHLHGGGDVLTREALVRPGRVVWILHPDGELPPTGVEPDTLQLLLLDGSWSEAARMRRSVSFWGRLTRLRGDLPPSRYGLRKQSEAGRYSTVEALGILMEDLGLDEAARQLRIQFELHVYAGLRARGAIREAAEFLAGSLLPEAMPECLRLLAERRRCGREDGRDPKGSGDWSGVGDPLGEAGG